MSVGAATLQPGVEHSYDLGVQLADRALYDAKERGRDGWVVRGRQPRQTRARVSAPPSCFAGEHGVKLAS